MEHFIQGVSKTFDIKPYLIDRGWSYSTSYPNTTIERSSENSGYLKILNYPIEPNKNYKVTFSITSRTTGGYKVNLNGVESSLITTNGYHEIEMESGGDISQGFSIWSDADGLFNSLNIRIIGEEVSSEYSTITWSEQRKGWVTFKDFLPESGFSMFSNLYTLKDGALWKHTVDATANNFYGKQHTSRIKFVVSSVGVKTYNSIAVHSDKVFGTTENGIKTELGNITDLITFDFDTREGIHYANKLRDVILEDKLKGRYIQIELTDEETNNKYFQLFKIILKSEISTPSE